MINCEVLSVALYYNGRARLALMCCVLCKDSERGPLSSSLPRLLECLSAPCSLMPVISFFSTHTHPQTATYMPVHSHTYVESHVYVYTAALGGQTHTYCVSILCRSVPVCVLNKQHAWFGCFCGHTSVNLWGFLLVFVERVFT